MRRGWWSCAGCRPAFPFYGTVVLQDGAAVLARRCCADRGALVRPELLTQLGTERRRAAAHRRPAVHHPRGDRAGAGPARRRLQLRLARAGRLRRPARRPGCWRSAAAPATRSCCTCARRDVERLTRDIRRDFRDRFVQARSYRSTEDDIGEDLLRAENYLSLVGFIMVVLGGIGVWSVTRVFVQQKIRSVAILKCVGATTRQVLATYVAAGRAARAGRQPAGRRARAPWRSPRSRSPRPPRSARRPTA